MKSRLESESHLSLRRNPRGVLRITWVIWKATYWGLFRNESFAHASNIAFSILSSLFPFIILLTGLAGYWGGEELAKAAEHGTGGIFSVLPEGLADILMPELKVVLVGSQAQVLTVGAVLLGIIVTGFVEALRMGLNYAYRTCDNRHFLLRRLESTFFVCISGIAILVLGFLTLVLPNIWNFFDDIGKVATTSYLQLFGYMPFIFLVIGMLAFLLLAHLFLPARKQSIKKLLPGVLVTATLWGGAGLLFSYYLSHFSGYTRTYAGLAGAIALMLFFYIIGLLFLLGAEINYAGMTLRPSRRKHLDSEREE